MHSFVRNASHRASCSRRINSPLKIIHSKLKYLTSNFNMGDTNGDNNKYDLVVIGGGSGGLACAKEAATLGAKVALVDYVLPSTRGTCWGIGGTRLNVGCVPKKLMHQSAQMGRKLKDAKLYGWNVPENVSFDWKSLRNAVVENLQASSVQIMEQLKIAGIEYINGQANFQDKNTVIVNMKDFSMRILETEKVVVAIGMRPRYPDNVPGAMELAITSDDIFSVEKPPGKTLVVGAGFVGMECASFLQSLGFSVTLLSRSPPLQRLDSQMVSTVLDDMQSAGLRLILGGLPTALKRSPEDKMIEVTWADEAGVEASDTFDTVLFAIGREVDVDHLCLSHLGVETNKSGKIVVDPRTDRTNVDTIFAVGDCASGVPELSPVAQKSGKLLARRLFGQGGQGEVVDLKNVPTCLFTTLEYACVGMSEEMAIKTHGLQNIQIHNYNVKECSLLTKLSTHELKVISLAEGSKEILGIHLAGQYAGETIQGFAAAMKCGITRDQLLATVGVHPTVAEDFTKLNKLQSGQNNKEPAFLDYFG